MVRDFVKNTPWRSREEKVTIQAFHKLVWHLECPREEVPFIYRIIKVMKKNRSIYKLLGQNVKIMKNIGRDAPPSLKMELASYVHWHTAYQMSINSVALRGLVNPDKRVKLFRLAICLTRPYISIAIPDRVIHFLTPSIKNRDFSRRKIFN